MATLVASADTRLLDNKYEIIREIKQGGFGIVYTGIDRKLNKLVAIKEIAPSLVEDPKYLDMFQEEAINIAKLNHTNIVHVYEFTKAADGRLYIIMEYIDGTDLEKIVRFARRRHTKIPPPLAIFIASQVCMALDYAHNRRDAFSNKPLKLVHQDISPSNIMISKSGEVKLIDFGIASVKRHRSPNKKDNKVRGKIPYMTPEQLIRRHNPDHRSDVFSLGSVLYEALTGERLFRSQEELIAVGKNPKLLKRTIKEKGLAPALDKILNQALEVDISKRYQSANHMYIDLLQFLMSFSDMVELADDLAEFVDGLINGTTPHAATEGIALSTTKKNLALVSTDGETYARIESDGWHKLKESAGELAASNRQVAPNAPVAERETRWPKIKRLFGRSPVQTDEWDMPEEEDLKTVIDLIRDQAGTYKRRIVTVGAALLACLVAFGAVDTMKGWTPVGTWIYDQLFPPAIEIVTIPSRAQIFLDDQEISSRAPAFISDVSPGVHKLQLVLDGYKPIVKSLFVPRNGAIRIEGESDQTDKRSYQFNFNTEIGLDSNPPGAEVILNGIRYSRQTPCTITWEVGTPLTIELEHHGFERLSGFSLNTLDGVEEIQDRRSWNMQVIKDKITRYSISGIFRKEMEWQTVPSGVEVFDYKTNRLLGVTGPGKVISLPAGVHELELRKHRFISQRMTLMVGSNSEDTVYAVLNRRVKFLAFNERGDQQNEIKAKLVSLKSGSRDILKRRRTTPFEMILPAYSYTAIFQKPGYQKREVQVGPGDQVVRISMESIDAGLEVSLVDASTKRPVRDVEIYYNYASQPLSIDRFFDLSDGDGKGQGKLATGQYVFKIRKLGYKNVSKTIVLRPDMDKKVVIELQPEN